MNAQRNKDEAELALTQPVTNIKETSSQSEPDSFINKQHTHGTTAATTTNTT